MDVTGYFREEDVPSILELVSLSIPLDSTAG